MESFDDFCDKHGLEVVIQQPAIPTIQTASIDSDNTKPEQLPNLIKKKGVVQLNSGMLSPVVMGTTLADNKERMRTINHLSNLIRLALLQRKGNDALLRRSSSAAAKQLRKSLLLLSLASSLSPPKIVVAVDGQIVLIGVNAPDRLGLMRSISSELAQMQYQLHHTAAAVVHKRSLSVWRAKPLALDDDAAVVEDVWCKLKAVLSPGVKSGLHVVRAKVVPGSRLACALILQTDFQQ